MLYVLRHCQTDWNKTDTIQGKADIPLNDTGRLQAKLAREKLIGIDFKKVYSSPASRALETVEIACRVPDAVDARLSERNFGSMEGKNKHEVNFPKVWNVDFKAPEDIESLEDIKKRVYSFLDEIKDECLKFNILVCAHGGTNMVIASYFLKEPESGSLYDYLIKNGQIAVYDYTKNYSGQNKPDII